jgi:hypothetical protein
MGKQNRLTVYPKNKSMNIEQLTLLAIPFGDLTPENKNELINYYQFIYNTKVCISCKISSKSTMKIN